MHYVKKYAIILVLIFFVFSSILATLGKQKEINLGGKKMNIINFNAIVRVELTELGRKRLVERTHKLYGADPILLNGNTWEAPLWKVMNMLGEYFGNGTPSIIVDGNLEIIQM